MVPYRATPIDEGLLSTTSQQPTLNGLTRDWQCWLSLTHHTFKGESANFVSGVLSSNRICQTLVRCQQYHPGGQACHELALDMHMAVNVPDKIAALYSCISLAICPNAWDFSSQISCQALRVRSCIILKSAVVAVILAQWACSGGGAANPLGKVSWRQKLALMLFLSVNEDADD